MGEARSPLSAQFPNGDPAAGVLLNQNKPVHTKTQCSFWKQREATLTSPITDFVQGKTGQKKLFWSFFAFMWLRTRMQAKQPCSPYSSALLSGCDRKGNVVLSCWGRNPKPSISEAEGRSQFPSSCKGSPGTPHSGRFPPLLTGPRAPHGSGQPSELGPILGKKKTVTK